ncbi:MAG: hypothetical protein ACKOK8_06300, partial [Planctomycetia bacterium]
FHLLRQKFEQLQPLGMEHPLRPEDLTGGLSGESIEAMTEAHRLLYRAKMGLEAAREMLRSQGMLHPEVLQLLEFLAQQKEGRHGRARERRRAA